LPRSAALWISSAELLLAMIFPAQKSLRSSPVAEAFEYLLDDFTQRSFNSITPCALILLAAHLPQPPARQELCRCARRTATINETLRLYPPAPVTVRYTEAAVELIPGVVAPPGSTLCLPIWSIHRSPHNFDDPDAFRPERFLGGEHERKHHR
jgi:hypothetical protein